MAPRWRAGLDPWRQAALLALCFCAVTQIQARPEHGMLQALNMAPGPGRRLLGDGGVQAAVGDAFYRHDALVDCPSVCKALGQVPVLAGTFGKALCAAVEKGGKIIYGTWMKGSLSVAPPAVCRLHSYAVGVVERVNGYQCVCKAAATVLTWRADLACAQGPTAAAQSPAICRIKRPGGNDYQLGFFQPKSGGGVCNTGEVKSLWNLPGVGFNSFDWAKDGAQYGMQLLCTSPPKPAAGAVTRVSGKPSCAYTCKQHGRAVIASSPTNPFKVLCINHLGPASYGTFIKGNCNYQSDGDSESMQDRYMCGCRATSDVLSWKQSGLCAQVPLAAATKPSICRIKKIGAEDYRIGAYSSKTSSCLVAAVPWGPQGKLLTNVTGLGGPYGVSLLCRDPTDTRQCIQTTASRDGLVKVATDIASKAYLTIIYDSRKEFRWLGLNESDYHCPPGSPRRADSSSFVSWVYWTAFGAGPDYLNSLSWKNGNMFTLGNNGIVVGKSKWFSTFGGAILLTPAKTTNARAADLVFYGYPTHKHVGIYIGNNKMISFAGNEKGKPYGRPKIEDVYARKDIDEIRSYKFPALLL